VQLIENVDKATNSLINTTIQMESIIRKYNSAQTELNTDVGTVSGMIEVINTHIL